MANEQQYKLKSLLVATRGVEEYRASIPRYIKLQDRVLEIGCEWGTTSEVIYQYSKNIVATDISLKCIEEARHLRPLIHFETLDVYNMKRAMSFNIDFNKMYIDVSGLSGYRSLLDVIALLDLYASVFPMEVIVIKSGALKNFANRCVAWKE
jgi:hypothetical protein